MLQVHDEGEKENDYYHLLSNSVSKSHSPNTQIRNNQIPLQTNNSYNSSSRVSSPNKYIQQNKMRKLATSSSSKFKSAPTKNSQTDTYSLRQIYNEKQMDLECVTTNLITIKNQLETQILNNFNIESKFQYIKQNLDQLNSNFKDLENFEKDSLNYLNKKFEINDQEMIVIHQTKLNLRKEEIFSDIDKILKDKEMSYINKIDEKEQIVNDLKQKLKLSDQEKEHRLLEIKKEFQEKLNTQEAEINDSLFKKKQELAILTESIQDIKLKIHSLQNIENPKREKESIRCTSILDQLKLKNSEKQREMDELNNLTTQKRNHVIQLNQESSTRTEELIRMKFEISRMKEEMIDQELKRRILHAKLQGLKGNIRVFCRIRSVPEKSKLTDIVLNEDNLNDEAKQELIISKPNNGIHSISTTKNTFKFQFDKIFSMHQSNEYIFEEYSQLIQSCIDGLNVCVFAYGQTGSGKTFTMSHPQNGMIPLSLNKIFNYIRELKQQDPNWEYSLTGKFLEIYNENIIDLLNSNSQLKHEIKHDDINHKTSITNITTTTLSSIEQSTFILQKVNSKRSTASTKSNDESSRSHSIFIIEINGFNNKTQTRTSGTLNLIDLAGSERISQSQVEGDRLKETQSINKSLSSLGDVIASLSKNQGGDNHIPFRNSKLTYLLKHSLLGNSKTLMFVNISPLESNFNETLNSLRFATKVNNTKLI
ncbi:KAR3 [Candida jiufengensis]|uniref:KAR3 n=1 Tax=Candida jiufengensis TaxID=497108 RepID=UPI002224AE73|nr:KAR3 [Candida jiufengensis]KAI5952396.1 KAR3 [Candida jiufengensis]